MTAEKTLTFYLEPAFRKRAEAGKINFITKVINAFRSHGFSVGFRGNSDGEILGSIKDPGYALCLMEDPVSPRGLTLRLAYFYPFWRIEKLARRWKWEVARTRLNPDDADGDEASAFVRQWRKRLYGSANLEGAREGYVYVPLQGRLIEHRSFPEMSPLDMIVATGVADPRRKIVIGLHTKETYALEELRALE